MNTKIHHLVVLFAMAILCSCEKEENFETVSSSKNEETNSVTSKAQSGTFWTIASGAVLTYINNVNDNTYIEFPVSNVSTFNNMSRTVTVPLKINGIGAETSRNGAYYTSNYIRVRDSELVYKNNQLILRQRIDANDRQRINEIKEIAIKNGPNSKSYMRLWVIEGEVSSHNYINLRYNNGPSLTEKDAITPLNSDDEENPAFLY